MKKLLIESLNISEKKGTKKVRVNSVKVCLDGILNDSHRNYKHRHISLLSSNHIREFVEITGRKVEYGEFAENITYTTTLPEPKFSILDELIFQNGVRMQVTQLGKKCHGESCEIMKSVGKCIMPKLGIFCKVLQDGNLHIGEYFVHKKRILNIGIIVSSDRAYRGEYDDISGKIAIDILKKWTISMNIGCNIRYSLVPDEENDLMKNLNRFYLNGFDIIFIIGGTGFMERDISSKCVLEFTDRKISGIMENIRYKYSIKNPLHALSGCVAGIKDRMQVYSLPGSVSGTTDYITDILEVVEHIFFSINGIDLHC